MEAARQALRDDGFVVLTGMLGHKAIDAHLAVVEPVIRAAVAQERVQQQAAETDSDAAVYLRNPRPLLRKAIAACQSDASQALFYDAGIHAFAASCFGTSPAFCHGSSVLYPTGPSGNTTHTPHADYLASAAPDPWTQGLRFWCALEDIHPDSGPFEAWRGSHRLVSPHTREAVLRDDVALAADMVRQLDFASLDAWMPVFSRLHKAACGRLAADCERLGLERVRFVIRKGDVVAFNPGIVHAAAPCANDRVTRRMMIYNLCHPGAAWYSPRAYWGALHDYRSPANRLPDIVEEGPLGLRWADYPAAFEAANNRPVVH